jgi:hypothetical protein
MACQDIIMSAGVFGSPTQTHQTVVVQEFAVDLVSRNGQSKVAALWREDKRPANDAPSCYFGTDLVDATHSEIGTLVCRYAQDCLTALDYKWGIFHVEDGQGTTAGRSQHPTAQHGFCTLTMSCMGYNALDMLLAAFLAVGQFCQRTLDHGQRGPLFERIKIHGQFHGNGSVSRDWQRNFQDGGHSIRCRMGADCG